MRTVFCFLIPILEFQGFPAEKLEIISTESPFYELPKKERTILDFVEFLYGFLAHSFLQ